MATPYSAAQEARVALANRLREIRNRAGLSGRDLASLADWHESKVSKIEHAKQPPSVADIKAWCLHCGTGEAVAEELVAALHAAEGMWTEWQRMERGDRRYSIIVEESALRCGIGTADVWAGQLGHLLSVSTLPSVSLGVIPFGVGREAAWPVESFYMFDDAEVNVELVAGYLTVTQPREIGMYAQVFSELAPLAVFGARARRLISDAVDATAMGEDEQA